MRLFVGFNFQCLAGQRAVSGGANSQSRTPKSNASPEKTPASSSSSSSYRPGRKLRPENQTALAPPVHRGQASRGQLTSDLSAGTHHVTCTDPPCFPGVSCEATGSGSSRCGRCPYGYTGDGVVCKGGRVLQRDVEEKYLQKS